MQRTHLLKLVDIDAAQLRRLQKKQMSFAACYLTRQAARAKRRELKRAQEELDIIPRLKRRGTRKNLPEIFADYEKQLKDFQEEIKNLRMTYRALQLARDGRKSAQIEKVKQDKAKAQAEKRNRT